MFWLLLLENLSPRTFENRPIWSHCIWRLFYKFEFNQTNNFNIKMGILWYSVLFGAVYLIWLFSCSIFFSATALQQFFTPIRTRNLLIDFESAKTFKVVYAFRKSQNFGLLKIWKLFLDGRRLWRRRLRFDSRPWRQKVETCFSRVWRWSGG